MKAKVYRENGYYFNSRTGEQYLWQDDAAATWRAMRRGEKKPSFRYKLRRFVRRFGRACGRAMERFDLFMSYTYHGEPLPLSEKEMRRLHIRPDDKVMVLGDTKNACRTG